MKCLRVFCILSVISLTLSSLLSFSASAAFEVYSTDPVVDGETAGDILVEEVIPSDETVDLPLDSPLEVPAEDPEAVPEDVPAEDPVEELPVEDPEEEYVLVGDEVIPVSELEAALEELELEEVEEVDDWPSYSVLPGRRRAALSVIGTDAPSNPAFYGSCWVTGYDDNLGEVTIYFPLSVKENTWGVDPNGYLYNITSSSVSGYLSGVYNNSVSASGFSYPRYREYSGSSYSYIDLHLIPSNSNMEIATAMEPAQNAAQLLPYIYVGLLGVIIVCFMKRW